MKIEIVNLIKALFPIFLGLLAWYMWSFKQKFALKKDVAELKKEIGNKVDKENFKEFKKEYYKNNEDIKNRLTRIETYVENMAVTMLEIKEYLFKRKRKD